MVPSTKGLPRSGLFGHIDSLHRIPQFSSFNLWKPYGSPLTEKFLLRYLIFALCVVHRSSTNNNGVFEHNIERIGDKQWRATRTAKIT